MYFLQSEHNPPHIHAIYNDDVAAINYMTGEVLEGYLPPKALAMVREWIALHKDTLQEIWETQEFKKIPPLEEVSSMFHKVKSVSPLGVGWMSDRNGARRRTASRGAAPHLGTICLEVQKSA